MECKIARVSKLCLCLPWFIPRTSANDLDFCNQTGLDCFTNGLEKTWRTTKADCKHCKDDCQMNHWYTTLEREPYQKTEEREEKMFHRSTSSGHLANYLIDPKNIFIDEFTRNLTMFTYGLKNKEELAEERFRRDIVVCNFFFDTPLITQIKQELKTTIFDMISAVGGTIALFTGVSVITLAELSWWLWRVGAAMVRKFKKASKSAKNSFKKLPPEGKNDR